jgi:hypothetical protein
MRSSLGQSAVRNGELGEQNAAPDAQNDGSSGAQDVTSDETRATVLPPPPPSKKSSRFIWANNGNAGHLSADRRTAVQRAGSAGPNAHQAGRASAQGATRQPALACPDDVLRRSLSQRRLVDLHQEHGSRISVHALEAANREIEMSERSEPKQVCRRNALAFLGYAAAFGLVASSAVLTASQAEAQTTTTTPTTPTTPPADTAKSGTEPPGTANWANRKAGLPQSAT